MEPLWIVSIMLILLRVANAETVDDSVTDDVHIPPLIRRTYRKMSAVIEQGDLETSLKYLRTIKTIHWLEPITQGEKIVKMVCAQTPFKLVLGPNATV